MAMSAFQPATSFALKIFKQHKLGRQRSQVFCQARRKSAQKSIKQLSPAHNFL